MRLRPYLRTIRAGDARQRLTALRSSRKALNVAVTGAALRTGLLAELREPASTTTLARRRGWVDTSLLEAALHSFAAHGLLEQRSGLWRTSKRGRRILSDDIVRAAYEAFSTYHTMLYRDLDDQLTTGGSRRDIEVDGELIARLSRFMDPFVLAELDRLVAERPPLRVLDVGCGTATHLCHVLHAAPDASGVGLEPDPAAAALARAAVAEQRLAHRAEIAELELTPFLAQQPEASFDLILLANMVYYIPLADRVGLLRALADRLQSGGRLLIVSTALTNDPFSRHFDLLLRAQQGGLELPDFDTLCEQLTEAGLAPQRPRRLARGEPLTAVVAHRADRWESEIGR